MIKILKTYYRFILKKRLVGTIFFIIIVLTPLVESILPYFYKLFVDSIYTVEYQLLLKYLIYYIGFYALYRVLDSISYFVGDILTFDAGVDARTSVFKKIHALDFAFHTTKSSGSLISAIKRGDGAFWDMHHAIHFRLVRVLVSFAVMMFFFANLNVKVFTLAGLSFLAALVVTKFFVKANIKTRTVFNKEEDKISEVIVDNMVNFETVKLFAKEGWEAKRLADNFKNWKKALWKFSYTFRFLDVAMSVVIISSIFFMLYLSLNLTIKGQFTPGDFVLVVGFTSSFYPKLFELVWGFRQIAKNYSDMQRYFGILDFDIKVKDPKNPIKPSSVKGEIEFKSVSFAYEKNEKDAVKNINLLIRPGQSVAFVGKSGAGKTTMIKLLLRFLDVNKGKITVDSVNISKITKSDLRSKIGVVPQEPILFNHTIGYNIAYGNLNASKKEVVAAAKIAKIHDFIMTLKRKYGTKVGERGIKLSGGQKQRVAIARMILSDPDIVVFDEATSQLDSESEKLIQEAFWRASKDKTTIIIAHRLSTIQKVDKIVVFEKGRIVEIGSHKELLAKDKSIYKHFWNLQIRI